MRLRELRIESDLKQKEVVNHVKKTDKRIDGGLYSKYENGVALPTPEQIKAICSLLGVSVGDIYTDDEIDLNGATNRAAPLSVLKPLRSLRRKVALCRVFSTIALLLLAVCHL